jgi:hypothetical protein
VSLMLGGRDDDSDGSDYVKPVGKGKGKAVETAKRKRYVLICPG